MKVLLKGWEMSAPAEWALAAGITVGALAGAMS
jgi:hypothetical protein